MKPSLVVSRRPRSRLLVFWNVEVRFAGEDTRSGAIEIEVDDALTNDADGEEKGDDDVADNEVAQYESASEVVRGDVDYRSVEDEDDKDGGLRVNIKLDEEDVAIEGADSDVETGNRHSGGGGGTGSAPLIPVDPYVVCAVGDDCVLMVSSDAMLARDVVTMIGV